jgi:hypothetical protein
MKREDPEILTFALTVQDKGEIPGGSSIYTRKAKQVYMCKPGMYKHLE